MPQTRNRAVLCYPGIIGGFLGEVNARSRPEMRESSCPPPTRTNRGEVKVAGQACAYLATIVSSLSHGWNVDETDDGAVLGLRGAPPHPLHIVRPVRTGGSSSKNAKRTMDLDTAGRSEGGGRQSLTYQRRVKAVSTKPYSAGVIASRVYPDRDRLALSFTNEAYDFAGLKC